MGFTVMISCNNADRYRRVVAERALIREKFPFLHSRICGLELICRGRIRPTEQSPRYRIELRQSPWHPPEVKVIEPKIDFVAAPHMYRNAHSVCTTGESSRGGRTGICT